MFTAVFSWGSGQKISSLVPQLDKGYIAYISWRRLFSRGTLAVSPTLKHESRTVATAKFVTFSSRSMIITSLTRVQLLLYRIKDRGEGGLGAIGRVWSILSEIWLLQASAAQQTITATVLHSLVTGSVLSPAVSKLTAALRIRQTVDEENDVSSGVYKPVIGFRVKKGTLSHLTCNEIMTSHTVRCHKLKIDCEHYFFEKLIKCS